MTASIALVYSAADQQVVQQSLFVTRFAKTRHNDAFLEFQIFAPVSFTYLKLFSVAISMLYC